MSIITVWCIIMCQNYIPVIPVFWFQEAESVPLTAAVDIQMFLQGELTGKKDLFLFVCFSLYLDDLTKSNLGSSSDSEKIIQRLNGELQEAQELANTEKHKCMELQGKMYQSELVKANLSIGPMDLQTWALSANCPQAKFDPSQSLRATVINRLWFTLCCLYIYPFAN